MIKKEKKKIERNIINQEIKEEKKFKINLPSKQSIIIKIIIDILIFSLLIYTFKVNKGILSPKRKISTFYEGLSVFGSILFLVVFVWLTTDILLLAASHFFCSRSSKESFFSLFCLKNLILTEISFCFFCVSLFLYLKCDDQSEKALNLNLTNPVTNLSNESIELTMFSLLNFFLSFTCIFIYVWICKLIISYVYFKIHYEHYKEKIENTSKISNLLIELEKKVMNGNLENPKLFFEILSENQNEVSYEYFEKLGWNDKQTTILFELIDVNRNDRISKTEFVDTVCLFYKNKNFLSKSLISKNKGIKKLSIITYLVFFPVLILLLAITCGKASDFKGLIAAIAGVLLPLNFIFGGVMAELLKSIILMFFVRPFDIGDKIFYNKEIYEVSEIGLLYTTLKLENKFCNISNIKLNSELITNLKGSKFSSHTFSYKTNKMNYFEEKKRLTEEVKVFLEKDRNFVSNYLRISVDFVDDGCVILDLKVKLFCPFNFSEYFNEGKEKFILFMIDRFPNLKICNKNV